MATFCGGIKLGDSLKLLDGIITAADTDAVDATKAVTACGQLFDGELFAVKSKCITTIAGAAGDVKPIHANCSLAVDKNVFTVEKGVLNLANNNAAGQAADDSVAEIPVVESAPKKKSKATAAK